MTFTQGLFMLHCSPLVRVQGSGQGTERGFHLVEQKDPVTVQSGETSPNLPLALDEVMEYWIPGVVAIMAEACSRISRSL